MSECAGSLVGMGTVDKVSSPIRISTPTVGGPTAILAGGIALVGSAAGGPAGAAATLALLRALQHTQSSDYSSPAGTP